MVKFALVDSRCFELTKDGNLKINIEIPKTTFITPSPGGGLLDTRRVKGFFKQGITILDGKKIRINFQMYEI